MTGAANIERMLTIGHSGTDYSLMLTAAWFIYGCMFLVPAVVYSFTFFTKRNAAASSTPEELGLVDINYTHVLSVYGYSNLSLVIVTALCAVPIPTVHTVALIAGAVNSGLFIYVNLWKLLPESKTRLVVVGAALACQAATYLAFYSIFLAGDI